MIKINPCTMIKSAEILCSHVVPSCDELVAGGIFLGPEGNHDRKSQLGGGHLQSPPPSLWNQ